MEAFDLDTLMGMARFVVLLRDMGWSQTVRLYAGDRVYEVTLNRNFDLEPQRAQRQGRC